MFKKENPVFAFMTLDTHDLKVLTTSIPTNNSPHNVISCRSNETIKQRDDVKTLDLTVEYIQLKAYI